MPRLTFVTFTLAVAEDERAQAAVAAADLVTAFFAATLVTAFFAAAGAEAALVAGAADALVRFNWAGDLALLVAAAGETDSSPDANFSPT
ncbi:MAG TPA: hypothetical protein VLL08_17945 [Kineosporiaceae bacterium]|nr:hypothetical protein [Kineosporiaceae bacterium]